MSNIFEIIHANWMKDNRTDYLLLYQGAKLIWLLCQPFLTKNNGIQPGAQPVAFRAWLMPAGMG